MAAEDRAWVERSAAKLTEAARADRAAEEAARAAPRPAKDSGGDSDTRAITLGDKTIPVDPRILARFRDRSLSEAGKSAEVTKPEPPKPEPKPQPSPQTSDVRERIAAREATRQAKAQAEQRAAAIAEYARAIEPDAQALRELRTAHARGDYEQVAQLLGAESWEAVQGHYVRTLTDPGHSKVLELERKLAEREAQERRQIEQAQRTQQEQQRRAMISQYKQSMREEMRRSSDPVLADLHDQPELIEALFTVKADHYRETGRELTLEQALDVKQSGNGMTIRQGIESYERFADKVRAARTRKAGGK